MLTLVKEGKIHVETPLLVGILNFFLSKVYWQKRNARRVGGRKSCPSYGSTTSYGYGSDLTNIKNPVFSDSKTRLVLTRP